MAKRRPIDYGVWTKEPGKPGKWSDPPKAKRPRKPKAAGGFSWKPTGTKVAAPKKIRDQHRRPTPLQANAANWAKEAVKPIVPGSDITVGRLRTLADAATQQQYGLVEQDLNRRYQQSEAMEQKIPQWFDYYRQQVQGLGQADTDAAKAAAEQITGIGTTLANATVQAASADRDAMAKDAAIRGATIDPEAYTRAIQAGNVNIQNLGTQAALQTTLGNNLGSYWRGEEKAAERGKVEQLLNELAYRRNALDPERTLLAREKGAFGQTYRDQYRQREQERVFNERIAEAGIFNDQAKIAQDQQSEAQDFVAKYGVTPQEFMGMSPRERLRTIRQATNARTPKKPPPAPKTPSTIAKPPSNFTGSEADWNSMSRGERDRWVKQHPTKQGAKPNGKDRWDNTPKERRKANDSFKRAMSLGSAYRETATAGGTLKDGTKVAPYVPTVKQLYDALVADNINPVIAQAAAQMIAQGYVDQRLARQLKRRGITSGYTTKNPKQTAAGNHPRT